MSQDFEIAPLQDASVLSLDDMKNAVLVNPEYQREGGIWPISKRQLLIDTLLNKYDVPKLYFHRLVGAHKRSGYSYSIIDGRQRLEAIWGFLRDEYPLSEDFTFLDDPSIDLRGKYFKDITSINSRISTRLYSRSLSVMVVSTDDIDYIEDMFTRLNDGAPLNSAEKRNSFGGPLPKIARELSQHAFFSKRVRVSATRYRHLDIAGKFIWLAEFRRSAGDVADTKRATVDAFFKGGRDEGEKAFEEAKLLSLKSLDRMAQIFGDRDALLRSSGALPVYFLLFMDAAGDASRVTRADLLRFEEERSINRERFKAEQDGVDFRLLEYDELVQSSNDAASIKSRLKTLGERLGLV